MTVLRNNFDTGPDGTAVTVANSDDVPGNDAFGGVYITGSGAVTYASAAAFNRNTAEYVARMRTTTPAGAAVCYWYTAMGSQNQIWARMYCYFTVVPDNAISPTIIAIGDATDAAMLIVSVNSADINQLAVENGIGTSNVVTSGSVTADHWFRIELRAQFSATTGNGELRWYDEADAPEEDYTEQLTWSNWNMRGDNAAIYYFGYLTTDTNMEDLYMSGLELNNTGWPGPAPFRAGKGVPGILTNPIAVHTDRW